VNHTLSAQALATAAVADVGTVVDRVVVVLGLANQRSVRMEPAILNFAPQVPAIVSEPVISH
jgi:hypothetical protein